MIVNKNTHPERDLYYLGGKLIEILDKLNQSEVDYIELYIEMKKEVDLSFNLFVLTLDWLYLIGVIKRGGKGELLKCF